MDIEKLSLKLDLRDYFEQLQSFFSRFDSFFISGDQNLHYSYIQELEKLNFNAPPKVASVNNFFMHLQKQGVLKFDDIFEFVKIVRYIRYIKNLELPSLLKEWFETIVIDERFSEIDAFFDKDGNLLLQNDTTLFDIDQKIHRKKSEIKEQLQRFLHSQKIVPYLVDSQIHYYHDEECLLLRAGFNHVVKGSVVGRSQSGAFYVVPQAVMQLKDSLRFLKQELDSRLFDYAKKFSSKLATMLPFLKFIDKEFSRFDAYQARVHFAKAKDLVIVKPHKSSNIVLHDFIHPALMHPKPISVSFQKSVLMITGVNAGGKTMLLKSILSAALMAKYLIPQKLNPHKSVIGSFKAIEAIIDDPQNVKNDISTFAGRMKNFSEIFKLQKALIGVDEIELGTDSDEAAALFKVILDRLIAKGHKIVITTHHKRLASLMANRDDVELMAALYDEKNQAPTYEFLQGVIGKSYAFETALRYGIGVDIVKKARKVYGDNSEKLNQLIERGSALERELKQKNRELEQRLEHLKKQEAFLKEQRFALEQEYEKKEHELYREFQEAISEAKRAAKGQKTSEIHRAMNKAYKKLPKKKNEKKQSYSFQVGDSVKYHSTVGEILSFVSKDEALIDVNGMKIRVALNKLQPAQKVQKRAPSTVRVNVEKKSGLKLDLHGLRSEEAIEKLDKFLSDALLDGWDEVLIYHGIGTGKLAYAVKEYLKRHPKVKKFEDAPPNMGGFGAKVVSL